MNLALVPRLAAGALLTMGGLTAAAPAAAPGLMALGGIERGQWLLRAPGPNGGAGRSVCITDPGVLLQIRHGAAQCTRLVIEDTARTATVEYSCQGTGHGRTTVTVETGRAIRIDTQGVFNGEPFALEFEGRRTGPCGGRR
jgi:hypothetical protein